MDVTLEMGAREATTPDESKGLRVSLDSTATR